VFIAGDEIDYTNDKVEAETIASANTEPSGSEREMSLRRIGPAQDPTSESRVSINLPAPKMGWVVEEGRHVDWD
jgi:hypothetical protein